MVGNWGEVVTRYPYRKVRMDHLLSKEPATVVRQRTELEHLQDLYLLFSFERPGLFAGRGFVFFDMISHENNCGSGLVAQLARAHD